MRTAHIFQVFVASVLVLLFAALIETSILSNITQLPVVPDLCLICLLFISLYNGKLMGEMTGFMSGLFLDFLSASPLGLNCLYRTLFGYVGGIFTKTLNTEGIFVSAFLGLCATVAKAFVLWFISFLYPFPSLLHYNPFSMEFVWELGLNVVLTPVVFKLLLLFRKYLILRPEVVI